MNVETIHNNRDIKSIDYQAYEPLSGRLLATSFDDTKHKPIYVYASPVLRMAIH